MCKDIKDYITRDEPFGPIDTVDIDDDDVDILKSLFEQHNQLYRQLKSHPSIIIGRKGSGKTAYLRSVFFDKQQYAFFTEIKAYKAFNDVINVIQQITKEALFPETVAEIWETIIWASVFSAIKPHLKKASDKTAVDAYLSKIGIRDEDNMDTILWTIADVLSERLKESPVGAVSELLKRLDKVEFSKTRKVVESFLRDSKKSFVILMDSMESLSVELPAVNRSLEGLLKLIGSMNKPKDYVDIRFCLPAELYHSFSHNVSSNPNKDFRRSLILQWTAPELISIGAQRLKIFLSLYHPGLHKTSKGLDASNKDEALQIFSLALPNTIKNQYEFEENTLAYILRHTQLLPRHFLMLLNEIFTFKKKRRESELLVNEDDVRNGIRKIEERIVTEIYVAFKSIYPHAETVCEVSIPELPHHFTLSNLQKVFNRHGKKYFGTDDFLDFKRMLLEIGAIGRYTKETNVYYEAVFEYTVPHALVTSVDDTYCLHPVFSGIYGGRNSKPVYPYGSRLEDEDYREQ
jgi:hypothetical protein